MITGIMFPVVIFKTFGILAFKKLKYLVALWVSCSYLKRVSENDVFQQIYHKTLAKMAMSKEQLAEYWKYNIRTSF